ncbi:MAG: hypothetical protein JNL81_07635 [Hyphomonadaceae bacterium]|nr:hypothetical protein [Hyphomonadaceae bacterium]
MKKAASIHLRRGKFYVDTESRTKAGIWVGVGAVQIVDEGNDIALAEALRSALEASQHGIPTPPPDDDLTISILEAAGVKTWRAFVRDATCVDAKLSDGRVTLTPYRKVDRAGNYVPIPEKAQTIRLASEELGTIVRSVFDDAG